MARALGVSTSTVSRALHQHPSISAATRARVLALAGELHYQPNHLAAGLRKGCVLPAVAGKVRGPGHHSHIIGPDGQTEYLIYHAWNEAMSERQLCVDKPEYTTQGPRAAGPGFTPQPIPSLTLRGQNPGI